MLNIKPTLTTVNDVSSLVHNLRERLQERDQDFRTLGHTKALHAFAEAKGYENWQQYSAALIKYECVDVLVNELGLNHPNAEAAWNTLSADRIRRAETGRELAEDLSYTYASVPLSSRGERSKEAKLNKAMLADILDTHQRLKDGENVDDVGVYGASVIAIEVCLNVGSASNVYVMVDRESRVISGRIETSGWDNTESLPLNGDQLLVVEDLYHIEIEEQISRLFQ